MGLLTRKFSNPYDWVALSKRTAGMWAFTPLVEGDGWAATLDVTYLDDGAVFQAVAALEAALEAIEKKGGGDVTTGRYWAINSPNDQNIADLARDLDSLIPIVDDQRGGVVAYALPAASDEVTRKLNQAG